MNDITDLLTTYIQISKDYRSVMWGPAIRLNILIDFYGDVVSTKQYLDNLKELSQNEPETKEEAERLYQEALHQYYLTVCLFDKRIKQFQKDHLGVTEQINGKVNAIGVEAEQVMQQLSPEQKASIELELTEEEPLLLSLIKISGIDPSKIPVDFYKRWEVSQGESLEDLNKGSK